MQRLAVSLLFLVSIASGANPTCLTTADTWQQAKAPSTIQLYYRTLPDSGHLEVTAATELSGQPEDFIRLLRQTQRAPEWMANVRSVEVLSEPEPNVDIVHTKLNAPWPVRDRDMVTRSTIKRDPDGHIHIQVTDLGQHYPQETGFVRMTHVRGRWQLTPGSSGTFNLCYRGSGSAAGRLPQWLSNNLLLSAMKRTFTRLRELPEFSVSPAA
ncbi:hypothetical protein HMF8227_01348 [Saliniradius amylolyticus]|uniref:START domain-containing protein n=1 Tax=Saliniradius amylolyticus TaxID=2183582 RepID=A0A2S2E2E7_9ALTE|nr:START domain-containing protein [Saliniradius amylolyticus]AWL11826.1 hypothetical protein HMF8227_01348 [Saliniradius amylolyticus]